MPGSCYLARSGPFAELHDAAANLRLPGLSKNVRPHNTVICNSAAVRTMQDTSRTVPPPDFDFIIGDWSVSHRRLNARLQGCGDWTEFQGTSSTREILGGFGNIEDNVLEFPDGDVRAVAIRSYDPKARSWAIWWLDGRAPHSLDTPVVGSFSGTVGTFQANDVLDGRPIQVRFVWRATPGSNPTWEQAFSADGGSTWETNWTMEFRRSTD